MRLSTNSIGWKLAVMLAVVLLAGGVAQATPVGFYSFDGNTNDVSGHGNHATSNSAGFGAGFEGQAADYTPNQVTVLPLNINPGVAPKTTIGAWVDADVVGGAGFRTTVLSSDNGGFDRGLNIDDRNGGGNTGTASYAAFTGSGGVLPGTTANAADGFVFMAATYDAVAGTVELNVNGSTFTRNATQGASQNFMQVGLHPFNIEPLNGRVDNAFVFNQALSSAQVEAIRTGGAAAIQSSGGKVISVDLQADGVNGLFNPAAPITNPGIGAGDTWNSAIVPSFTNVNPIPNPAVNPSFTNLVDNEGNPTGAALNINGSVSGYNNGDANNPINTDYIFWGISGTSTNGLDWSVTGLTPGAEYELSLYGGSVTSARGFNALVDTDADGSLADELAQLVVNAPFGAGATFASVFADAAGTIIGQNSNGIAGGEANWGGLQLRELSAPPSTVPEPATAALALLGLAALARRRRRA